jgi:hypothetical protein
MSKIKVIVTNKTGSENREAELCLISGLISYASDPVEYVHISCFGPEGKKVFEQKEVIIPVTLPLQSPKKKPKK